MPRPCRGFARPSTSPKATTTNEAPAQPRECDRPARPARLRGRTGIEVGREVAFRRGPALQLANDGDPTVALPQRRGELAGRRGVERGLAEQVPRLRVTEHRDLVALGREDVIEDGQAARSLRSGPMSV